MNVEFPDHLLPSCYRFLSSVLGLPDKQLPVTQRAFNLMHSWLQINFLYTMYSRGLADLYLSRSK